jgi:hypothetical protein
MVSALVLAGQVEQARAIFERLGWRAGPLGLFSEPMAPDGTALGNHPQAITHLPLIDAAVNVQTAGSVQAPHAWAAGRRTPADGPTRAPARPASTCQSPRRCLPL